MTLSPQEWKFYGRGEYFAFIISPGGCSYYVGEDYISHRLVPRRPYIPPPLALCCHYPVSKCRSASIAVTGTLRVNIFLIVLQVYMLLVLCVCVLVLVCFYRPTPLPMGELYYTCTFCIYLEKKFIAFCAKEKGQTILPIGCSSFYSFCYNM